MQHLLGLHCHNTVTFQDVTLNLAPNAIVTVGGRNENARSVGDLNDSNAVGKTLMWSTISNLLFERVDSSAASKSKKAMYSDGVGFTRLYAQAFDEAELMFEQDSSGRYSIQRNGTDYDKITISNAVNAMHSLLPISEEYWHQLGVLSSKNVSPFVAGKPEARRAFFSSLYNLDYYDLMLADVKKRLAALNKETSSVEGFNASIGKTQARLQELPELDLEALQADKDALYALEAEVATLPSEVELTRKQRRLQEIDALLATSPDPAEADKAKEYLDQTSTLLDEQQQALSSVVSLRFALNQFNTHLSQFKRRNPDYSNLTPANLIPTLDDLYALQADLFATYPKFEQQPEQTLSALHWLGGFGDSNTAPDQDSLLAVLAVLKTNTVQEQELNLQEAKDELDEVTAELQEQQAYARLLRQHSAHGQETCPVCHAELDQPLQDQLQLTLHQINELQAKLKDLNAEVQDQAGFLDLLSAVQNSLPYLPPINWVAKNYAQLQDDYFQLQAVHHTLPELEPLADELEALPASVDAATDPEQLEQQLRAELDATLAKRRQYTQLVEDDNAAAKLEREATKLDKELEGVDVAGLQAKHAELKELRLRVNNQTQLYVRHTELNAMLANLKVERAAVVQKMEDIPPLEALATAYSSRGVRLNKVKRFASDIAELLQENAYMLFSEQFEFESKVTDRDFKIIAHRNNNRSSTDVAQLSKSEGRRFELLFMYCLNKRLPAQNRMSMVALDEMEDGSSELNKQLYREVFLPHLNELIPSVFVISPLAEMRNIPGAKSLTVVKDGSFAHLETDYPELLEIPAKFLKD